MEFRGLWNSGAMPVENLMPRKRKHTPSSRQSQNKKHISQASITRQTVTRYISAMNSFFSWRRANGLNANPKFPELDLQLGNYLNFLYQNDKPLYLGINCIAGFKKFQPRCKRQIDTACSWLNNWSRVTRKVRAMPLHPELVKAFVAFGILKEDTEFALAVYVGFLGLLRGGEILNLSLADCQPRGPSQLCIILRDTKGARLRNVEFETVTLRDPMIIKILLKCKKEGRHRLFNKKPSDFYKRYREAVAFFNLKHPKPTPHGIRRGGASWHFKLHGSFDRTVEHGRWASVGSARIYINEAAAEESALGSCVQSRRRIADAIHCCPGLLREAFGL
jgi:integrase